jgi:mono/diheme cytochrome c family protein
MASLVQKTDNRSKRLLAVRWAGRALSGAKQRTANRVRTRVRNRRIVIATRAALAVGMVLLTTACGGSGQGALHSRGGQLFVENCGSCHTLAAAGTGGTVGPDLDGLFAGRRRADIEPIVRRQIATGGGAMPAGILTDGDADAVAEYVASAVR